MEGSIRPCVYLHLFNRRRNRSSALPCHEISINDDDRSPTVARALRFSRPVPHPGGTLPLVRMMSVTVFVYPLLIRRGVRGNKQRY